VAVPSMPSFPVFLRGRCEIGFDRRLVDAGTADSMAPALDQRPDEMGSFSYSIFPFLILSRYLPTVNARWNWLRCAFSRHRGFPTRSALSSHAPASSHCPLPTAHCPLPTRDATCDHLLIIRRHRRLFTGHWSLATGHSRRHSPLTAGRKSGSFSCSISPFFVLSANIHWINARAIWLRFSFSRRRRLPSAFTRHWPLARRNDPLLSRRHRCLFVFTGH
jgi:hypothetical protein